MSRAEPLTQRLTRQIWASPRDGGGARRLTWSGEENHGARWSPDSRQIAFISDRAADQGILVLPMDGGEAREAVRHSGPISDLAWSPDGIREAYAALVDPTSAGPSRAAPVARVTRRRDYKHDGRGYLNDARLQVFVVDVERGESRQLTHDLADHFGPAWSPDGMRIAAQVHLRNGLSSRLAIIDAATGETSWLGGESGVVGLWAWSSSGDRMLFADDDAQTWQLDFFTHDLRSGMTRRLTNDLDVLPQAGFPTV